MRFRWFLDGWGGVLSQREGRDDIDRSGAAIFSLLHQAVETSRAECDRANETAHEYSLQLQAAKDLVNQLQIENEQLKVRARRAEDWLNRIQGTIADKFVR
jgi:hypothetical protein